MIEVPSYGGNAPDCGNGNWNRPAADHRHGSCRTDRDRCSPRSRPGNCRREHPLGTASVPTGAGPPDSPAPPHAPAGGDNESIQLIVVESSDRIRRRVHRASVGPPGPVPGTGRCSWSGPSGQYYSTARLDRRVWSTAPGRLARLTASHHAGAGTSPSAERTKCSSGLRPPVRSRPTGGLIRVQRSRASNPLISVQSPSKTTV